MDKVPLTEEARKKRKRVEWGAILSSLVVALGSGINMQLEASALRSKAKTLTQIAAVERAANDSAYTALAERNNAQEKTIEAMRVELSQLIKWRREVDGAASVPKPLIRLATSTAAATRRLVAEERPRPEQAQVDHELDEIEALEERMDAAD